MNEGKIIVTALFVHKQAPNPPGSSTHPGRDNAPGHFTRNLVRTAASIDGDEKATSTYRSTAKTCMTLINVFVGHEFWRLQADLSFSLIFPCLSQLLTPE